MSECVPDVQAIHAVDFGMLENEPNPQTRQTDAPGVYEYLPSEQWSHCTAVAPENVPMVQLRHSEVSDVSAYVPGEQFSHAVEPGAWEKNPGWHERHADVPMAGE